MINRFLKELLFAQKMTTDIKSILKAANPAKLCCFPLKPNVDSLRQMSLTAKHIFSFLECEESNIDYLPVSNNVAVSETEFYLLFKQQGKKKKASDLKREARLKTAAKGNALNYSASVIALKIIDYPAILLSTKDVTVKIIDDAMKSAQARMRSSPTKYQHLLMRFRDLYPEKDVLMSNNKSKHALIRASNDIAANPEKLKSASALAELLNKTDVKEAAQSIFTGGSLGATLQAVTASASAEELQKVSAALPSLTQIAASAAQSLPPNVIQDLSQFRGKIEELMKPTKVDQ